MSKRKIYFGGSISCGRQDVELYGEIIQKLKQYGEVLTEHIGNPNITAAGEQLSHQAIFDRDINWLCQADVFVAEVTTISDGVGFEAGAAYAYDKPMLLIYRPDVRPRLGFIGASTEYQTVASYSCLNDLDSIFDEFFASLRD